MRSYKPIKMARTSIISNDSVEGETIEKKFQRILNNKEKITDGAPLIYTERKQGILAAHNIRTDRWEIALEATEKIQRSLQARREERANLNVVKDENPDSGAESIQGTN